MREHIRRPDGTLIDCEVWGITGRRLARALARRGRRIAGVELIEDRGEAAVEDEFFRSRRVPRRRGGHPHAAGRERGLDRGGAADRPRDPGLRPPRRDLALLLPRGATVSGAADRPRRRRPGARAGWSASSSATASASPPALRGGTRPLDRPRLRPRRAAQVADERPPADPQERGRRLRASSGSRARLPTAERPGRVPRRLHRDDARRRGRRALLLRRRLLRRRCSPRRSPGWSRSRGPDGDVAAAALAVRSDGFLHYYLSGTADDHRRGAPSKNLIVAANDLADELELPLNLGGGLSAGGRARGVQARLRQPRAPVPDPRADLRPRRLRRALGRSQRRGLLPALPGSGLRSAARARGPSPRSGPSGAGRHAGSSGSSPAGPCRRTRCSWCRCG